MDRSERFVYDGQDVVLVFDGGGSLTTRYLHGPAVDQVFASEDALGDVLWALADHQGSVRDLAEYDAGTGTTSVVNHRKYDSFGRITAESAPAVAFRYAYTGRVWDADAELFYYRARWYDPAVGRFLSEDPLGFAAGDVNLTRYVGNSPVNFVDPSGRRTESVLVDGHEVPLNPWDDPEAFSLVFVMNLGTDDGGYSNWFTEWFGEGAIRPYFGDERLTEPGGLGDDLLLSTRLATEITGILDPTPLSDILNATTHLVDGNHGDAGMALAGALIPGGLDKLARHGDVLLKPIEKVIDYVNDACFVAGTQIVMADSGVVRTEIPVRAGTAQPSSVWSFVAIVCAIPVAVAAFDRRRKPPRSSITSYPDKVRSPIRIRTSAEGSSAGTERESTLSADSRFSEPVPRPANAGESASGPANDGRPRRTAFSGARSLRWSAFWLTACLLACVFALRPGPTAGPPESMRPAAGVSHVDDGYRTKNIEEVVPGDFVLAADSQTGRTAAKRVVRTFRRTSDHIRQLTFATPDGRTQVLQTTDEHPFWLPDQGRYAAAASLALGDRAVSPDGELQRLVDTSRIEHPQGIAVYNFEVEGHHNYYAAAFRGDAAVLVHNDCWDYANELLEDLGGEIWRFRTRPGTHNLGHPDALRPGERPWAEHYILVKDGTVFDKFHKGTPLDEYMQRWLKFMGEMAPEEFYGKISVTGIKPGSPRPPF